MNKPQSENFVDRSHLLPKSEQFAILQRIRDRHIPKKKFTTETEDVIAEMAENNFITNVLDSGLSNEWMESIYNGRP